MFKKLNRDMDDIIDDPHQNSRNENGNVRDAKYTGQN